MHIAVLSDPGNFHTQKWVKALMETGAKVTVFSYDGGKIPETDCVQVKPPVRQKGNFSYSSYLLGGRALNKELNLRNVDIVNALNITPFGVWALKSGKRPLIASALGADILEYPPELSMSPSLAQRSWDNVEGDPSTDGYGWKRRFHRRQVGKVLQGADLVTGDNQTLLDAMQDWFGVAPASMKLLRWGVEPELFDLGEAEQSRIRAKFGIHPGQTVVLSPRGAKAIYQGDLIIEAFAKLLAEGHADCRFILLGAGYTVANKVEQRAAELEKAYPNFLFVRDQLPREEVAGLWNEVDLFVSAPVYDGYSAALAEGRFVGAVPVVNDIPATQELIRHKENGWVTHPFTVDQLSQDLSHLLAHLPEYQYRFAAENKPWITQNSLQSTAANQFIDWCKILIEKRAR